MEWTEKYKLTRVFDGLVEMNRKAEQAKVYEGDVLDLVKIMNRENVERRRPRQTHGAGFFEKAAKFVPGIERGEDTPEALTRGYRFDGQHGLSLSPAIGRYRIHVFDG